VSASKSAGKRSAATVLTAAGPVRTTSAPGYFPRGALFFGAFSAVAASGAELPGRSATLTRLLRAPGRAGESPRPLPPARPSPPPVNPPREPR
jgi:hypothetical protein